MTLALAEWFNAKPRSHSEWPWFSGNVAIVCLQAWNLKSAGARLNQLPFEINSIEGRMSGAEFFAALKSQAPTAENILVAAGMKKT